MTEHRLEWTSEALTYSLGCIRRTLATVDGFPERTEDGQWITWADGWWVGGHWVGLLWRAYEITRDSDLEKAAYAWAARLAPRAVDGSTHDLGFLFELSHVLGWQLTGNKILADPALQAAKTLAARFHPCGHYIQAWGPVEAIDGRRGRSIIDTMMNLELLFWASRFSGDPVFAQIAASHARSALAFQVRPDGSTAHVADFDPETGRFLRQETHQGLSAASCWSRGQSWAVYGFTNAYQQTGESPFLQAARQTAAYALSHLPPNYVPYWDYNSPDIPADVRDSSAGAVLAAGLLHLAELEDDPQASNRWQEAAISILASLWQGYSSRGRSEPSILIHATRSKPHDLMDHGLIYGDYYFVEALLQVSKKSHLPDPGGEPQRSFSGG